MTPTNTRDNAGRNHYRPYVAASRWYLTNGVQPNGKLSNGLMLIRTSRHIPGACPVVNPASILKSLRETCYPVGIQIEHAPQIDAMLPKRFAKRFDPARYDLVWHEYEPYFTPEKLRWTDDASYAVYQGDASSGDYNAEGWPCEVCDRIDCAINHSEELNERDQTYRAGDDMPF